MDTRFAALIDAILERSNGDAHLAATLRDAAVAVLEHLDAAAAPRNDHDATFGGASALEAFAAAGPATPEGLESVQEDSVSTEAEIPAEPVLTDADLERLRAWATGGQTEPESVDAAEVFVETSAQTAWRSSTDDMLGPLAERFAAKAAASRWRADGSEPAGRNALNGKMADVDADRSILNVDVAAGTPFRWRALAESYEAAATAADVLSAFADAGLALTRGTPFAHAVVAAAEASSCVRTAYWQLRDLRPDMVPPNPLRDDADQLELFRWLREATEVDQIFVERHMRWQDPADPARAADVRAELRELAGRAGVSLRAPRPTATAASLKAAIYHAGRMKSGDWDLEHQQGRLLENVDKAVAAGVPPTDVRFRELLGPIADLLPDADAPDVSQRASRVLAAVYEYLFESQTASEPEAARESARPEHVRQAADLLRGKRLAIFGGVLNQQALDALQAALELASAEWVETRAHQSTAAFEPVVARSDIAVQLIRFSSHSFADLREMCAANGAAFVRAPRGYSPSAIAHAILEQVSRELSQQAGAS